MRARSCACAMAVFAAACGNDPSAGELDASRADAFVDVSRIDVIAPDAAPCNALVLDAPAITDHEVLDADAPLPAGGTIAAGRYWLVDVSVYVGPDASAPPLPTRREVHEFDDAGLWQYVDKSAHLTLLATPMGTLLHRDVLCPADARAKDSPFSATDAGVTLFDYTNGVTTVFSLARQ